MTTPVPQLLEFLGRLSQERISYTLAHHREDAIMVLVAVPGARWEVEFFADGTIDVEVFLSDGAVRGPEMLARLFEEHGEPPDPST